MKLTKDEAYILSRLVDEGKYELANAIGGSGLLFEALEDLQYRLTKSGDDRRRRGRTSMNDHRDILGRFLNRYLEKNGLAKLRCH